MMAAGNPNWHNMQQQSNIPLLGHGLGHGHGHSNSPLFSLLHHQLNLHGGPQNNNNSSPSSSSSSSSTSSASSTSSLPFNPLLDDQSVPQDLPQSWSQLLLGGLANGSEEERLGLSNHLQGMNPSPSPSLDQPNVNPNKENLLLGHHDENIDEDYNQHHLIKQEGYGHGHGHGHDMNYHHEAIHHHQLHNMRPSTWPHMVLPVSSPKSCVTTLSSNRNNNTNNTNNNQTNLMDFSSNSCKDKQLVQNSAECNSRAINGGAPKKPRVQSTSIPPLKVRKEKLGDRITALHQLVSPFGKTDTASVLFETIGCIRFLQGQIQALSSPYLGNPPSNNNHQFNYGVRDETLKELRSKGLCLVPISCTQLVGSDSNTASEYWAPSIAGGF